MAAHSLEILLVEDNQYDVIIARRALQRCQVPHRLKVARDGQEAIEHLHAQTLPNPGHSRPDLILLDLNLPRVDGFEVLRFVKADGNLRSIPVVVLTTSEREDDVRSCYQLGANTFISKPVEFERFIAVIQLLSQYWGGLARLPTFPG